MLSAVALSAVLTSVLLVQGGPQPVKTQLYVDAGANGNGSSPASPLGSITAAVNLAKAQYANDIVTINVRPGTYQDAAPANEVFPVRLPSHGVTVEAWHGDLLDQDVVVGNVGEAQQLILVDSYGTVGLPPSSIEGLRLQPLEAIGVHLAAPAGPNGENDAAVQVRQCRFEAMDDGTLGLYVFSVLGTEPRHQILHNDFAQNEPIGGSAIIERQGGGSFASTLYRSNLIARWDEGFNVYGAGSDVSRPRLHSNTVLQCERPVVLGQCSPEVVNNTFAFTVEITASAPTALTALSFIGPSGTMNLYNNLFWNPNTPAMSTVTDWFNVPGTSVNQSGNRFSSAAAPKFMGGDTHPGLGASDVHLTSTSPAINSGDTSRVAPVQSSVFGTLAAEIRLDLAHDVDLDPRISSGAVDVGSDEWCKLTDTMPYRLARTVYAGPVIERTIDVRGTLRPSVIYPGGVFDYATGFDLAVPANTAYAVFVGFAFDPLTGSAEDGAEFHHEQFGDSWMLDSRPTHSIQVATGVAPAGTFSIPFSLPSIPSTMLETEFFVQVFLNVPGQGFRTTNRLYFELDQ